MQMQVCQDQYHPPCHLQVVFQCLLPVLDGKLWFKGSREKGRQAQGTAVQVQVHRLLKRGRKNTQ